ncbi:VPLPA-CTERM sorting domain-containing protein [Sneathiella limimaris]|uniref:VPLPA-CTERM sorting domain-containing protein n=1 Tax=Sneathiella limimaris TaxID=1964213 RepID=UPI00146CD78C|nr:VPLPA-CTERM sorting domain-containing protein [Sneathiella limimaris]
MLKRILASLGAVIALTLSATAAQAITMQFTNGKYDSGAYHYSEGGYDLTASANFGGNHGGYFGQSSSSGLYVTSYKCSAHKYHCYSDNHQIDGYKKSESITLTFNQEVSLQSVYFNYVGYDDDFSIMADAGPNSVFDIVGGNRYDSDSGYYDFADGGLVGTVFTIAAPYYDDDFKLAGLQFSPVSAVPLPPAVLMFGAALIGLGVLKRRKQV